MNEPNDVHGDEHLEWCDDPRCVVECKCREREEILGNILFDDFMESVIDEQ